MTTNAYLPLVQRARVGFPRSAMAVGVSVGVSVGVALLSGCGGGGGTSDAQDPVVTVTTTPTVTASVPGAAATTTTRAVGPPKSDVVGRKFDLGTIVKVEDPDGRPVLIFDRWSARGMSDAKVAAGGVQLRVHSDAPYENLNTTNTFRIPVVEGAIFTYNHCVSVDQPAQQRSSTLKEFATLGVSESIMLLTLDPQGQVFKAENDPAC